MRAQRASGRLDHVGAAAAARSRYALHKCRPLGSLLRLTVLLSVVRRSSLFSRAWAESWIEGARGTISCRMQPTAQSVSRSSLKCELQLYQVLEYPGTKVVPRY